MEYQDKIDILEIRNRRYKQAFEEIKGIIQNFPNENSSIDWEAKAHRAIEIVKQISEVLK